MKREIGSAAASSLRAQGQCAYGTRRAKENNAAACATTTGRFRGVSTGYVVRALAIGRDLRACSDADPARSNEHDAAAG